MYFVLRVFTISLLFVNHLKTRASCSFAIFATSALGLPGTIKFCHLRTLLIRMLYYETNH